MRKRTILHGIVVLSITAAAYFGVAGSSSQGSGNAQDAVASGAPTAPTPPANAFSRDAIEIDYSTQKIIVTVPSTSKDKQILFGIATVKAKGLTKELKTTASWEVYDVAAVTSPMPSAGTGGGTASNGDHKVVIDISTLNTQKDNYIQIKGNVNSYPLTLHIPATDNKVKMKFDAFTGKLYDNKGSEESKTYKYEYRTTYSTWADYGTYNEQNVDLSVYQQRGATLYFRQKPEVNNTSVKLTDGTVKDETGVTSSDTKENITNVYEVPTLPGKEIKVSIGKKAAGPKVTVNYLKNTVTIPKDSLYRINTDTGLGMFSEKVLVKIDLMGDELTSLLNGNSSIDAKKAGDVAKKKAESKISHVDFPKPKETLKPSSNDNVNGAKVGVETITGNDITAEVTEEKGSYKLTLKNNAAKGNADFKYEVIIRKSTDANKATPPLVGEKVTKAVAGGATASITKLSIGDVVWIHKAGNAKTQTWATDYVKLGEIKASAGSSSAAPTQTGGSN